MRPGRAAAAALLLGCAVAVASDGPPVEAQQAGCEQTDEMGDCILEVPVPVPAGTPQTPASPSDPDQDTGSGDGPSAPPPACRWRSIPTPDYETYLGPPPPEYENPVMQWYACDDGPPLTAFRWVEGGSSSPTPTPPAPGVLARTLVAAAKARMHAPTLSTAPAEGVSAVVGVPVFVEVTNWQDEFTEGPNCVLGVCVSLRATPTLTFDPGDGSPAITCPPPGSRYMPGGPPMADQASGACAHTYEKRTGVAGRPAEWPGVVTVTWDVSWTSSVSGREGPSGAFDPLVFSQDLPRAVDEVATVVVDGKS